MKAVISLLCGLSALSFAAKDIDWDSNDEGAPSYNGIIVQVYQDTDEAPVIALGSEADDYEDVYCLNLLYFFEASTYNVSQILDASYTAVEGTEIDLADADCVTNEETTTIFSITCSNVDGATLELSFTFIQDADGDYGLEYTISLAGYSLSDASNKLVMVQTVKECSDLISLESEEDTEDTESTETPEDAVDAGIRRLLQEEEEETTTTTEIAIDETEIESEETDEESLEEEDGISSDETEFDAGFARFVVDGQAWDNCNGTEPVPVGSFLVYQQGSGEVHIVFDSFECDLTLDPFYGLDESKYEAVYGAETTTAPDDMASNINVAIVFIMSIIAIVFN